MTTTPVPSITDDQLAEIEALAREAIPGPWKHEVDEDSCYGATFVMPDTGAYSPSLCRIDDAATAEFVAVTNPATILAMIYRIRELEKVLILAKSVVDWATEDGEASADLMDIARARAVAIESAINNRSGEQE